MAVIDNTWTWRQLAPATPPPHRNAHDMVWDPVNQRVVMYGGQHYTGVGFPTGLDDTWALVGDEWFELAPGTVPPARIAHAMVYDDANERVLMMGGRTHGGVPLAEFDETWEFAAGDWNQLSVSPISDANNQVYNHVMVWDPGGARALALITAFFLDGGNQTWEFSAGDWHLLALGTSFLAAATVNGTRELSAACWADDRMLVAAGGIGNQNYTNDVFELVGSAWANTVPYVNTAFGGSYVPWRFEPRGLWTGDQFFFYGGQYNASSSSGPDHIIDSPYLYDKNTFALTSFPLVDPGLRTEFAMVWTGTRVVMFGGVAVQGAPTLGDTWVLEPPPPPLVAGINHTFGLG